MATAAELRLTGGLHHQDQKYQPDGQEQGTGVGEPSGFLGSKELSHARCFRAF